MVVVVKFHGVVKRRDADYTFENPCCVFVDPAESLKATSFAFISSVTRT